MAAVRAAPVYGISTSGDAGYFLSNLTVTCPCTGCLGPSKVDDPLDPSNKYLYYSSVQSPDRMDIYNGNVTTDDKDEAIVAMPTYFGALNRDFRYHLTPIDRLAQAAVLSEIKDNAFSIKTDKPT